MIATLAAVFLARAADAPSVVPVTHDDTRVDRSCFLYIPPGLVIADTNGNGVIQVVGRDHAIQMAPGCVLRGAPADTPADQFTGIGIRLENAPGTQLLGLRVHGFKVGVLASQCDRLVVDGGDLSGNYRQRLRSTPEAEDSADWLFPHHNDDTKWRDQYGAALCIESSTGVTVRNLRVRRGQNGIVLDRVTEAQIYDNDCSFLSGWGLALWRSSRNVVARNAFDFCIRGHVEGVYNRGQDSAGILCFEQCNDNVFAHNSVTHGGDGFFGFGGREAIGELWMDRERARLRRETGREDVDTQIQVPPGLAQRMSGLGCNRNLLLGNDFSYAAAHGIELTFSEDNVIADNRLVENAICGLWGGYSSRTLIARNHIEGNGGMAYGLERGGINMEHAAANRILDNTFLNNRCAIHLWWDDDSALHRLPGVSGNLKGITENLIANNTFELNDRHPFGPLATRPPLLLLQLRDTGTNHVRANYWISNRVTLNLPNARLQDVPPGAEPLTVGVFPAVSLPTPTLPGTNRPVGARSNLRGRDKIVVDEWGPWDHQSPLVRPAQASPGSLAFEFLGLSAPLRAERLAGDVSVDPPQAAPHRVLLRLSAPPGVHPFRIRTRAADFDRELTGTLVHARWEVTFFPWNPAAADPRTNLAGWRALASGADAAHVHCAGLDFAYAWGGPKDLKLDSPPSSPLPGADHFGMIARTHLPLPAGSWRLTTLSDDGVRVLIDGRAVIDNWSWHGPTRDSGTLDHPVAREAEIQVEHFEIDGYAVLQLLLEPADLPAP